MRTFMSVVLSFVLCLPAVLASAEAKPETQAAITLPAPRLDHPALKILARRQSRREFDAKKLPMQTLAEILWAAAGINRPDSGKRTAPSAMNWQEVDVYAATADGLFLFDAKNMKLVPLGGEDIRAKTGMQAFVATAPLNLIFVADYARMGRGDDEAKARIAHADAALMAENVYFYCAAEDLAVVVRASFPKDTLAAAMKLRPDQHPILVQTVGLAQK